VGQRGTVRAGNLYKCMKKALKSSIGYRIFVHHRLVPAIKRTKFVSDRISYIVLKGRWCNIIVLNVRVPSEEKNYDSKESFMRN
jgi:hypothetical protein